MTKKPPGASAAPLGATQQQCTCPSGDGSLRWPCPTHPPLTQQQGVEQEAGDGLPEPVGTITVHDPSAFGNTRLAKVYSADQMLAFRDLALRTKQPAASEGDDGDGVANCAECGAFLESVRPGKHQHPTCSQANTSKQAAGEAVAFALLPEMTDPMGRYWKQPAGLRDRVRVFAEHVTIDERDWLALSKYETTNPSGAYTGKVWRRGEFLCWYGAVSGDRIAIESKRSDVQTSDTTQPRHPADEGNK